MFKSMTVEEIAKRPDVEKLGDIETITMIYDQAADDIILNSSNPNYDICIKLVESYLNADCEKRERLKSKIRYLKEEVAILDEIIKIRLERDKNNPKWLKQQYAKEFKMINDESAFYKQLDFLEVIWKVMDWDILGLVDAYNWGYIQGKKVERARRKKA